MVLLQLLKPLEFTYILYEHSSLWSLALVYCSFIPIIIGVALGTLVLFTRELEAGFFAGGILLNAILNIALKNTLQQPRPEGSLVSSRFVPLAADMVFLLRVLTCQKGRVLRRDVHTSVCCRFCQD